MKNISIMILFVLVGCGQDQASVKNINKAEAAANVDELPSRRGILFLNLVNPRVPVEDQTLQTLATSLGYHCQETADGKPSAECEKAYDDAVAACGENRTKGLTTSEGCKEILTYDDTSKNLTGPEGSSLTEPPAVVPLEAGQNATSDSTTSTDTMATTSTDTAATTSTDTAATTSTDTTTTTDTATDNPVEGEANAFEPGPTLVANSNSSTGDGAAIDGGNSNQNGTAMVEDNTAVVVPSNYTTCKSYIAYFLTPTVVIHRKFETKSCGDMQGEDYLGRKFYGKLTKDGISNIGYTPWVSGTFGVDPGWAVAEINLEGGILWDETKMKEHAKDFSPVAFIPVILDRAEAFIFNYKAKAENNDVLIHDLSKTMAKAIFNPALPDGKQDFNTIRIANTKTIFGSVFAFSDKSVGAIMALEFNVDEDNPVPHRELVHADYALEIVLKKLKEEGSNKRAQFIAETQCTLWQTLGIPKVCSVKRIAEEYCPNNTLTEYDPAAGVSYVCINEAIALEYITKLTTGQSALGSPGSGAPGSTAPGSTAPGSTAPGSTASGSTTSSSGTSGTAKPGVSGSVPVNTPKSGDTAGDLAKGKKVDAIKNVTAASKAKAPEAAAAGADAKASQKAPPTSVKQATRVVQENKRVNTPTKPKQAPLTVGSAAGSGGSAPRRKTSDDGCSVSYHNYASSTTAAATLPFLYYLLFFGFPGLVVVTVRSSRRRK